MIVRSIVAWSVVLITWLSAADLVYGIQIIGPSGSVYALPGETATLNCTIRNLDTGVSWLKVEFPISETLAQIDSDGSYTVADDTQYGIDTSLSNRYDLVVKNVDLLEDDGTYECDTTFNADNVDGEVGTLVVLDRVDSVMINDYISERTITVDTTTSYEATCEATDGNPGAELLWLIGDKDITEFSENTISEQDSETKLYDSVSLLNYTFNASDDGQSLLCRAFQHEDLSTRSSWRINLNVQHIPIISEIEVTSWSDGGVIKVECADSANPDSTSYVWEAEGGQYDTTSENTWQLIDTGEDDKEEVTCTATNSMGSSESYTQIITKPSATTGASSCDTGCIIGVSVGVAVFVFVIIIIIIWFCLSQRKKKNNSNEKYAASTSNHNRQTNQAPSDVEMTPGTTSVPPPNDDVDAPRYSNGNNYDYDDNRYENRYDDQPPRHRYDDPPDNYRYDEPPIDEGDGYPNSPTEPTYAAAYSRSPGRQAEPQLQYADLDLRGPSSQSTPHYQPQHTEYATITPTIV